MIVADKPAGVSGTGKIAFSLNVPTDASINSGTFSLKLPEGLAVDVNATALDENIAAGYNLSISNKGDSRLFKSATETAACQKILDIVCRTEIGILRYLQGRHQQFAVRFFRSSKIPQPYQHPKLSAIACSENGQSA
jgi:hypothetical protein